MKAGKSENRNAVSSVVYALLTLLSVSCLLSCGSPRARSISVLGKIFSESPDSGKDTKPNEDGDSVPSGQTPRAKIVGQMSLVLDSALDASDLRTVLTVKSSDRMWASRPDQTARSFLAHKESEASNAASESGSVSATESPCAELPKLSKPFSNQFIAVSETICWALASDFLARITHEKGSERFIVSQAEWQALGITNFLSGEDDEIKALGAGIESLYLGNKSEIYILSAQNEKLSAMRIEVGALNLTQAPLSISRSSGNQPWLVLSLPEKLYFGKELATGQGLFEWHVQPYDVSGSDAPSVIYAVSSESGNAGSDLVQSPGSQLAEPQVDSPVSSFLYFGSRDKKWARVDFGQAVTAPGNNNGVEQKVWEGTAYLSKYCLTCHSSLEASQGDFQVLLSANQANVEFLKNAAAKEKIKDRILRPESDKLTMPPYAPRPSATENEKFLKVLFDLK